MRNSTDLVQLVLVICALYYWDWHVGWGVDKSYRHLNKQFSQDLQNAMIREIDDALEVQGRALKEGYRDHGRLQKQGAC